MAYPTVAATGSGNSGSNATQHTITLPTHAAGDLVLVTFEYDATGGTPTCSVGASTGTWVQPFDNQTSNCGFSFFYRVVAGAGETLRIDTTESQGSAYAVYVISAGTYSGVPERRGVTNGANGLPNPGSNTASWGSDTNLFIAIYGWDGNNAHVSYPANYTGNQVTNRWANTQGCGVAMASRNLTAATDDPGTANVGGGTIGWEAETLVIQPYQPVTHALGATLAGRLDTTATGSSVRKLGATLAARLDATATGSSIRKLSATLAAQLDATASGTALRVLSATLAAQLDATATGEVVLGGGGPVTHALSATLAAQLDAVAIGTAIRTLGATLAGSLDAVATGGVIRGLSATLTGRLDATADGSRLLSLSATLGARLDATASGQIILATGEVVSDVLVRRTLKALLNEMIRSCGGIQYTGWKERAQYLFWEAYLDLTTLYYHPELEFTELVTVAAGSAATTYPAAANLLIGVAESSVDGQPISALEHVHIGQWSGSLGTVGRPLRFATLGDSILFDRVLDIDRNYLLMYQRPADSLNFDVESYSELPQVWDGHLLELSLVRSGARTLDIGKYERHLKVFDEYMRDQGRNLRKDGLAQLRAARETQDSPQSGRWKT